MCHENPLYTTVLVPRCWPNSGVTDWLDFHMVNMHLVCTDHGINTSLFFNAGVSLTFLCEPTRFSSLLRLGPGPQIPLHKIYQHWAPLHWQVLPFLGRSYLGSVSPQTEAVTGNQKPCQYLNKVVIGFSDTLANIQTTLWGRFSTLVPLHTRLWATFPPCLPLPNF